MSVNFKHLGSKILFAGVCLMPARKTCFPEKVKSFNFQYLLNYFMSCHYTEVIKRKKKEKGDAVI